VQHVQTDAILANPVLYEMAENSTMDVYDAGGKAMLKVSVEMKDGREFSHEEDYAAAMAMHPGREFLEEKFRDQAAAAGKVSKAAADKIIELNSKLETLSDMREYTSLLQF